MWGVGGLWGQVDITYGRLEFAVAPPARLLQAQVEWHFRGQEGPLMSWDLAPPLVVHTLTASLPVDTFWQDTASRKVYVRFAQAPNGQPAWIRASYSGEPRTSGFGSYEVREHATGWCLWTLSEPYGAPDWLLCRDGLSDKVDSLDITLRTPDTLLGVANGRLIVDSVDASGWRWRHFRHRHPIAVYLIAFAASNYIVQEFPVQTPYARYTLRNYVYPQDTAIARRLSEQFLPYFVWLEERVGPYPFADEDYQQVQIGWGGGMEHQTITFFGRYTLELWAHELAHQWFGDWVTCGSWQDIWLNEAFATYLGGLVYEALLPEIWPIWHKLTLKGTWRDTARTIWVEDTASVQRIFWYPTTYQKGAVALHALRDYLGDSLFWVGLRAYLAAYPAAFARTADFLQAVRALWGEAAEAFITGWIYQPGFPSLQVEWLSGIQAQYLLSQRYPLRLPTRILYADGRLEEITLDLLAAERIAFQGPVQYWLLDPDTLTPYWGPRRLHPPATGGIWPIPFQERLYLSVADLREAILYDLTGRIVARYDAPAPEGILLWELPALPAGPYLLYLQTSTGQEVRRLLRSP